MAAYAAASALVSSGAAAQVTVLEKMPRVARKIMISGKGRCNFTNVKAWNEFSGHIRSKPNFVRSAFHALPPEALVSFFEGFGMKGVVERGDRAFPASHRSSDVVDTLVSACHGAGVKIECSSEVSSVERSGDGFRVLLSDGREYLCPRLIVATGGLSYPGTGSTGDGYRWAAELGHRITPTFPSLTALVPKGYKDYDGKDLHIDRSTPLGGYGRMLCGIQLKNVGLSLVIEGTVADSDFGDVDFTDGGLEGPLGFRVSRKAVKSLLNGSRVSLVLDLKGAVPLTELTLRIKELWKEVDTDPRTWQHYAPGDSSFTVLEHVMSGSVPAGVSGTYRVGIWMPDGAAELANNRYDNRFDVKWGLNGQLPHWRDAENKYCVNVIGEVTF